MIGERFITRIAHRLSDIAALESSSDAISDDYLQPMIARDLLATPKRQAILKNIWQRTALSRSQFDALWGLRQKFVRFILNRLAKESASK